MERGYVINANILRDAFLDKINALQSKTLCQIFDEYLAELNDAVGISISSDTFYNYSRTLVLLKEYVKKKSDRNDIALQELNYSFIESFSTFLRKEYSQRKNTAVKYLRCLKRVVNIAIANRYLTFDPFLNFKVQREVVDKVFLTEEELRVLNQMVSGYFDFAEVQAIRHRPMYMSDYVEQLDNILRATGEELLTHAGKISHAQAMEKARAEYKRYQAQTLSPVEEEYLKTIKQLGKTAKTEAEKQDDSSDLS